MTKLILWLSTAWLPFLFAYMLLNETKFKKNIVIGVTLPKEAREDSDVLGELASFKRNVWITTGILMVLAAVMYLFSSDYAYMTSWMIWIVLSIVLPYIPYVIANMHLKELKEQKGWKQEKQVVHVNTAVLQGQKWLSPWLFVPPVILCLVPMLFDRQMAVMYVTMALLCASFWFGYRYLYRNKAEMVDDNAELTAVLTQIRRYNWGKMWLLVSYSMAGFCITAMLSCRSMVLSLLFTLVLTVLIVFFALRIEMKTRTMQEKLTAESGSDWYVDEDDHWLGGLVYYNPDDSRMIINHRIGTNSSVNLAHPGGKVFMALSILMFLALPFMGMFFDGAAVKDITLQKDEEKIVCTSGMGSYTVPMTEIDRVELLEELPSDLRRVMGTGTDTLLEGSFASDEIGNVKVNLDPRTGPYLLIRTADGKNYLFGSRTGSQTREIYEDFR